MINYEQPVSELTLVAFDLETSGAYPVGNEIVEFGAVKWCGGQIVDQLQILIKPRVPMGQEVIAIHGITNEMVAKSPSIETEILKIRKFIEGALCVAHHAPFDVGFLSYEFERHQLDLPREKVLCSSLLGRRWIAESPNHRLQTLIKHLGIDGGTAHRALDDAKACLEVTLECFRRSGLLITTAEILKSQGKVIEWKNFSLLSSGSALLLEATRAIIENKDLEIKYGGGSLKGQVRRITPVGIVRNPDGDYLSAICHIDRVQKRFYVDKILDAKVVIPH